MAEPDVNGIRKQQQQLLCPIVHMLIMQIGHCMSKIETGIFGNFSVSGGEFYTFKTGIPGGPGFTDLPSSPRSTSL